MSLGSGTLSRQEFEEHLKDGYARSFLAMSKIDRRDAKTLFSLMDVSGDDELDIQEFTEGILKLNGYAKNVDMVEVRDSQTGYSILAYYGLGVWLDEGVVGAPSSGN